MIAIPLTTEDATTISEMYGNAPFFALLDDESGIFSVIKNDGCGDGVKTAQFVKEAGAVGTIFYHMGEGVYKELNKAGIDVYSATKCHLSIDDIYASFLRSDCKLVTQANCDTLLDPGTSSCSCECK